MSLTEKLKAIYYDPTHPASLSRPSVLAAASGGEKRKIEKWLKSQPAHTLHKQVRKRYPTRQYVVDTIDSQWQADLADMQAVARHNNGYKYILTVIDILSRYAWARPLKTKAGHEVAAAFADIFQEGRIPERIQTDQGKEFENSSVRTLFNKHQIELFSVKSAFKAAMVERFNRTLKSKIWKFFTAKNTYRWIDNLQNFVSAYNKSFHRMIKMKPIDVTRKNAMDVWQHLYGKTSIHPRRPPQNIKVGDRVRISKVKSAFAKGYLPNWTEEEFFVDEIDTRFTPVMYRLIDYHGNRVEGSFYREELQVVDREDEVFIIDRILRKRRRGGKTWYLVHWRGYPSSFDSWVPESDLQTVEENAPRQF